MNVQESAAHLGVSTRMVYQLAERMHQSLEYDKATGEFTRINQTRGAKSTWGIGTVGKDGYRRIAIGSKRYLAHRLAWLYVYGRFPDKNLDHINGDRLDNRVDNLREATHAENLRNKKRTQKVNNYLRGAKFVPVTGKWTAKIVYDNKVHHLGTFPTEEDAHLAYVDAAKRLHREFARFE